MVESRLKVAHKHAYEFKARLVALAVDELDEHLSGEAKRYIADNNVKFYIVNAIDKAREIGMGKRTNTILQSAFFALANIMPIEEAVEHMKYMAKKSYLKKGEAVVEMNYKAIDAGKDAIVKIDVPTSWKTIEVADDAEKIAIFDDFTLLDFITRENCVMNEVCERLEKLKLSLSTQLWRQEHARDIHIDILRAIEQEKEQKKEHDAPYDGCVKVFALSAIVAIVLLWIITLICS